MMLSEPCNRVEYQWLSNVKINEYAKFDLNIPCVSSVMSILLTGHDRRTDARQSLIHLKKGITHTSGQTMLICLHAGTYAYLIRIYHEVQEL